MICRMATQPLSYVSVEEYLRQESLTDGRNDYRDGEVIEFRAATLAHALICSNVGSALKTRTAGRRCSVFDASLNVCVQWGRFITHPDITVVCGQPELLDNRRDVVTNPRVLIEVLSPSTRDYDVGTKATRYRNIPSLAEYLIIEQEPTAIDHYRRIPEGSWRIDPITDPNATIRLESINVDLPVSEIYAGVAELPAE